MNDKEEDQKDSETILMALDQISQTIDVMNSVVGRLRHYVEEQELNAAKQELSEEAEIREAMRPGRILH
jgi:Zn-dependent oligopeptidase